MSIALLFSGQGAQSVGMGASLQKNEPIARAIYEQADAILGYSLSKICFEGPEDVLTQTKVCQPALFVHGYAIYSILKKQDRLDQLKTCLGLSLGELTALTAAGAFDFETGLKTVAERGRLMQEACEATEGGMVSLIGSTKEVVAELCESCNMEMANLNCPGQIVVSGPQSQIEPTLECAKKMGIKIAKPLNVAGAYHSRLMEPARAQFEAYLSNVSIQKPHFAVYTNTTGDAIEEPEAIRAALATQVVSSVLWEDCMRNAATLGIEQWYECGPAKVLAGLARRIDKSMQVTSISDYEDLPT